MRAVCQRLLRISLLSIVPALVDAPTTPLMHAGCACHWVRRNKLTWLIAQAISAMHTYSLDRSMPPPDTGGLADNLCSSQLTAPVPPVLPLPGCRSSGCSWPLACKSQLELLHQLRRAAATPCSSQTCLQGQLVQSRLSRLAQALSWLCTSSTGMST